ncbi:nad-dependent dehydratase [Diplodia corticola]|uniref:Nad-dependent dehydratase n=1 Tax=Diplodia corticola TaxID=236234 RepID=A0A1J9RWA6_9PEZI|nr:nad-dependent dehydratase [Diplodia corticola]OJD31757.1 nad-dependent dehydratase [Diplodia corticola]
MKVLLVGATGFVGSFTLRLLLADPAVSAVVTLTRSALSASPYIHSRHLESPKLIEIVHAAAAADDDDSGTYPAALLDRHLRGVRACLWCVGGRHTQRGRGRWPTDADYVRASVDLPVRYAEALRDRVVEAAAEEGGGAAPSSPPPPPPPFRFVFCSGHGAEWDQGKSLWVMGRTRKVKGMAEKALFELAEKEGGGKGARRRFETYSVRPCGIYQKNPSVKDLFMTSVVLPSCHVEELAAVMVEIAKNGSEEQIVVHERIRKWGGELLKQTGEQ